LNVNDGLEYADPTGQVHKRKLALRDVSQLDPGHRIVVPWNEFRQPIGKAGQLYHRYLSEQGGNYGQFDISAETWKRIWKQDKEWVWENKVKVRF